MLLKTLTTTAGFLEQAPITFGSGLTCIIGARGTCKSTIVETIRFVFDCDAERVRFLTEEVGDIIGRSESPSARGLIRATLSDGTARCDVEESTGSGISHSVERSIGSESKVFQSGVREINANSRVLSSIEIYSQGDLQRIAEQPQLRLQLVDRPNQDRVNDLVDRRRRASEKLRQIGQEIRRLRAEIETRRDTVRSLETYRRDLADLQSTRPSLSIELTSEREAFTARKALVEKIRRLVSRRDAILATLEEAGADRQSFKEIAGQLQIMNSKVADDLSVLFLDLYSFLDTIGNSVQGLREIPFSQKINELEEGFEALDKRYYELRKQQVEVNESLKKEDALRQQIELGGRTEIELTSLSAALESLLQERAALRKSISTANDELYELRLAQVTEINGAYSDVVALVLQQGAQSCEYRDLISSLLEGSRLRNQDEVAADLAHKILPSDLIDITESCDAQRLAEALGRDLGQMTRLLSYLLDHPRLYSLEGIIFEDRLEITMFFGGQAKPIAQLSKGQMATALLPLILRDAAYPLIFDQPEDDLDNAFVYKTLITRVRELKLRRQLIFVTHNANIPVLGEAERILVMAMDSPQKARQEFAGGVDEARSHILSLLEGGAEAFRKRQEKYGALIRQ